MTAMIIAENTRRWEDFEGHCTMCDGVVQDDDTVDGEKSFLGKDESVRLRVIVTKENNWSRIVRCGTRLKDIIIVMKDGASVSKWILCTIRGYDENGISREMKAKTFCFLVS